MSVAEVMTSALARVLVSVVAIMLLVSGLFHLFDGEWVPAGDLRAVVGLLGLVWVVRTQSNSSDAERDSAQRVSPWVVLLIGSAVLVVLALTTVGVVCGNERGFSCGG